MTRQILVTGAAGFIGTALVRRILADPELRTAELTLVDLQLPDAPQGSDVIEGDLAEPDVLDRALGISPDLVFHLAVLPGGAAEVDYKRSRRINLDATLALLEGLASRTRPPRLVYASTIAVFGAPLPALVNDDTSPVPSMTYGAHKLMAEIAIGDFARRGLVDAFALRLPGIVARPRQPNGLRSAFMSDVFHALLAGEPFEMPVSPDATAWLMSVERCVENLAHAAMLPTPGPGVVRALTLPAIRATMRDLVAAIATQVGHAPQIVRYAPDAELEAQFGRQPPLVTPAAERLGFRHDGDLSALVAAALRGLLNGG